MGFICFLFREQFVSWMGLSFSGVVLGFFHFHFTILVVIRSFSFRGFGLFWVGLSPFINFITTFINFYFRFYFYFTSFTNPVFKQNTTPNPSSLKYNALIPPNPSPPPTHRVPNRRTRSPCRSRPTRRSHHGPPTLPTPRTPRYHNRRSMS